MTKRTGYTISEVERYKTRMFRQHQREIQQTKTEWYQRGRTDGHADLLRDIRNLLGLDSQYIKLPEGD